MTTVKLTKKVIDGAKAEASEQMLWDTEVRGLGLKVTPSGKKVFALFYRTEDGTQRKPKIGEYGVMTLDQAREKARDWLADVRAGRDPSATRQAARESPTVSDVCDRFIEEHAKGKKPQTLKQYKGLVNNHVKPAMGSRKIASVTDEEVERLIRSVGADHPIAANRLRAVLRKMFVMCEGKWKLRPKGSNPCSHIERYTEIKRHRDLDAAELARLAKVFSDAENGKGRKGESPRAIAALRLLMFTGCRKSEILHLRWNEVDLEKGILRLTDSKTGQKEVHLNQAAKDVIEAQGKVDGNPYVFPGLVPGKPIRDLGHLWERLRKRADIGDMRMHDLRHHFASTAAGQGFSLPMIGALLGHKDSATTARYAVMADRAARQANEQVGRVIAEALVPAAARK